MNDPETLAPLLGALQGISKWLQSEKVPGMIIGGVAASILGRPRLTRDVDASVWLEEERWEGFLSAGSAFGFEPRIAGALTFAAKSRVLLLHHTATHIELDLAFASLPFEEKAISRAVWTEISGIRIPIPSPEDMIVMKALAHRPRDLSDIEAIVDAHPKLNLKEIRRSVREFSLALGMPELERDLNLRLKRRKL